MNFMTLQRPTMDELERRRQLRESLSPLRERSTTLQRRESMLSRGLNAIMRRQSFMSPPRNPGGNSNGNANHLKRHDSFFMHSTLAKDPDNMPPLSMMTNDKFNDNLILDEPRHPFPMTSAANNNSNNDQFQRGRSTNLARAKSFKYPERISQMPPAELTRLRSKSQVRSSVQDQVQLNSSGGEDPMYTSGSGGSASGGSGKSPYRGKMGTLLPPREERRGNMHPQERPQESRGGYAEDLGYGQAVQWLSREKFFQERPEKPGNFQPPPRMSVPRPTQLQGKTSPRDISEPPPTANKKRLPLPDIFYYGDRWQEQETRNSETRSRSTHQVSSGSSLETPEPPPGSSDIIANNNNNNR